jgi:pimeloyl-ACP methyl ester carboxylesterase
MNPKPTIVLVHGAFAESSSWNSVIDALLRSGHEAIAYANPLRSVSGDAAGLSDLLRTLDGPVVLAGHSYGGSVITAADPAAADIKALVYVAAFAPEAGESALELSGRWPGSTLGAALSPIARADGTTDLAIQRDRFHAQFAADVSTVEATLMASTQRSVAQAALEEPAPADPLWKAIPAHFIHGDLDLNIPPAALRAMAERAGAEPIELTGASHALGVSRPSEVAEVILKAAATAA